MKKSLRSTYSLIITLSLLTGPIVLVSPVLLDKAIAAEETKTFTPYYGTGPSYVQPENVQALFPKPTEKLITPAFQKDKVAFTSQEEMMDFLLTLTNNNPNVKLEIIGQSLEGHDIPMLLFSKDSRPCRKL
ncbi:hypothetical protein [Brevibacillus daliensis]|uniref:hypothetical protein n=1 Tax=Brevibacillus daliensis TaxID=2892995 RepID=UPI001E3B274F|nr:hypothetical protein [Brevibacillus daliensis]